MIVKGNIYVDAENVDDAADKAMEIAGPDNVLPTDYENVETIVQQESDRVELLEESIRTHVVDLISAQDYDPSFIETIMENAINNIGKIYRALSPSGEPV